MYLISVGCIYDNGVALVGPFDDAETAIAFAEKNFEGSSWYAVPVEDPETVAKQMQEAADDAADEVGDYEKDDGLEKVEGTEWSDMPPPEDS